MTKENEFRDRIYELILAFTISIFTFSFISIIIPIIGSERISYYYGIFQKKKVLSSLIFIGEGAFLWLVFCVWKKKRAILDFFLLGLVLSLPILLEIYKRCNFAELGAYLLLIVIVCIYFFDYRKHALPNISDHATKISVGAITILYIAVMGALTAIRHKGYASFDWDLGYFDQAFYYLSKTGKFTTTLTLGGIKSDVFQISHVSPILYLLYPLYLLWTSPYCLLFIQVVFVAISTIPIYKLSRYLKIQNSLIPLICLIFLLHPGIIGGLFYDFHENAFLPVFLLFLIYFAFTDKWIPMIISFILTLSVKDDTFVFTIALGLYLCLAKGRDYKKGVFLIITSIIYFYLINYFIIDRVYFGERYTEIVGLISGNKDTKYTDLFVILLNHAIDVIKICFSSTKWRFLLQIFITMGFLPLLNLRSASEATFYIPLFVFNLLGSRIIQYTIEYHYLFGVVAMFIPLLIMSALRIKPEIRTTLIVSAVMASIILIQPFQQKKLDATLDYFGKETLYQEMDELLTKIPENAIVLASPQIYPHLSERENIMSTSDDADLHYPVEYIALDLRPNGHKGPFSEEEYYMQIASYLDQGYGVLGYVERGCVVLEKGSTNKADEYLINQIQSYTNQAPN